MIHPLELNRKSGIQQFELPWRNPIPKLEKGRRRMQEVLECLSYKTNASVRAA